MVFGALNHGPNGGEKWLIKQRNENPVAFLTLLGKFVPRDINIGGQSDNPVVTTIRLVSLLDQPAVTRSIDQQPPDRSAITLSSDEYDVR